MVKARDPVCGMAVDPKNPPAQTQHKGKTYYFCAPKCLNDFVKDPERYLRASSEETPGDSAAVNNNT